MIWKHDSIASLIGLRGCRCDGKLAFYQTIKCRGIIGYYGPRTHFYFKIVIFFHFRTKYKVLVYFRTSPQLITLAVSYAWEDNAAICIRIFISVLISRPNYWQIIIAMSSISMYYLTWNSSQNVWYFSSLLNRFLTFGLGCGIYCILSQGAWFSMSTTEIKKSHWSAHPLWDNMDSAYFCV